MKIISAAPSASSDRGLFGISDDRLVAESVDPYYVDTIVAALNATYSGERFFKAVPEDYQLRTYEP